MKNFSALSIMFPLAALCAAAPAQDAIKNGGFEMPGTVVNGWAGKQHWVGWGNIHGKSQKSKEILALCTRSVTDKNPASGKYAARLLSPKSAQEQETPAPMFSNKIAQTFAVPVSAKSESWQLKFKIRGVLYPSKPHSGMFFAFVEPFKTAPAKPGKLLANGKGLQKGAPVKEQWQEQIIPVTVPAGTSKVQIVLALYQAGEVYLDDIAFVKK